MIHGNMVYSIQVPLAIHTHCSFARPVQHAVAVIWDIEQLIGLSCTTRSENTTI